jgi:hypothetical protein
MLPPILTQVDDPSILTKPAPYAAHGLLFTGWVGAAGFRRGCGRDCSADTAHAGQNATASTRRNVRIASFIVSGMCLEGPTDISAQPAPSPAPPQRHATPENLATFDPVQHQARCRRYAASSPRRHAIRVSYPTTADARPTRQTTMTWPALVRRLD